MKYYMSILMFLVLAQWVIVAQPYEYEIEDDHFQDYIKVVGPRAETRSGNNIVEWQIIGTVNRSDKAREYLMLWWTTYTQSSISYREYDRIVLPGAINIYGENMGRDRNHVSRRWRIFEIWAAVLTEPVLTAIDVFRFYARSGQNVDGTMPTEYIQGLTNAMMELVESME